MIVSTSRAAALAIALLLAAPAPAANHNVVLGGSRLVFDPQTLEIRPGDTVTFRNLGGLHNVVADDGRFRCARGCDGDGAGGSGTASQQLWIARIEFPEAGTFGYFCEPHGAPGEGMFGTIVVAPQQAGTTAVPSGGLVLALVLGIGVLALARRRLARA